MLSTGQKTVTTAGTRVALGTGVANSPILVKALSTNTGIIYVGDVTVTSGTGFCLGANETMLIREVGQLGNIYVDASIAAQKVCWIAYDEI